MLGARGSKSKDEDISTNKFVNNTYTSSQIPNQITEFFTKSYGHLGMRFF